MGLGRRTFSPGEVLTASNVMNYLQDQAVMSFAGTAARGSAIGTAVQEGMVSYLQDTNFVQVHDGTAWRSVGGVQVASGTAARDALLPSPVQGDKVFRSDLGYEQTYYGAHGTANPGGRASAGWYDNQRNMGLVPIVPPTVNYSGGTATANTLGAVSFSAVTSISFNNVFTSAYSNYRINFNITAMGGSSGSLCFRLRNSGADRTSVDYLTSGVQMAATGTNSAYSATTTFFDVAYAYSSTTSYSNTKIDISDAFATARTKATATTNGLNSAGQATSWQTAMLHNLDQSQDGFTIFGNGASQTLSGSIQVYAYNI